MHRWVRRYSIVMWAQHWVSLELPCDLGTKCDNYMLEKSFVIFSDSSLSKLLFLNLYIVPCARDKRNRQATTTYRCSTCYVRKYLSSDVCLQHSCNDFTGMVKPVFVGISGIRELPHFFVILYF